MSNSEHSLPDGLYLLYPKQASEFSGSVVLTLVRTTSGGGTMLEGGLANIPRDVDLGLDSCDIPEGDYLSMVMSQIYHSACEDCSQVASCPITGVQKG